MLAATFGTPWPNQHRLTLSIPADGVKLGEQSSNLWAELDAVTSSANWQELYLRAFQTWAVHADINVGLRSDHDLPFGTPGKMAGDSRFGDFRIGAVPQTGVLASSLPYQMLAGTFSGDILLDSNSDFIYHDWANDLPPDPANNPSGTYDLFSLLLHETGNALGLDDTLDSWTVMFRQYDGPKGILSQDDINEIQSLYGARTDPYEGSSNDQMIDADLVSVPVGFDPQNDVIRKQGSLASSSDVDYYEFVPLANENSVTIDLKAAGVSLVQADLEVLDESGLLLVQQSATSSLNNDLSVTVSGLASHSKLFLKISAPNSGVYSVGDYDLVLDYRSAATRASDPVPGAFDGGIESLWTHFSLVDSEVGVDDSYSNAVSLTNGVLTDVGVLYELEASVGPTGSTGVTDQDHYSVTAPAQVDGPLAVHVATVGDASADLRLEILDNSGASVGAVGRLRDDGTWVMQVAQPVANSEYLLKVSVDPSSTVDVGNYILTANFSAPSAEMNQLVSRSIDSGSDEFVRWSVANTKLYRFDLTAVGANSDEVVKVTIYDAHTKEMKLVIGSPSGMTRAGYAMLDEGDYILRFTAFSKTGASVTGIQFDLMVNGLSDDQDLDGQAQPDDYDYYYQYPYGSYYDYYYGPYYSYP